MNAQQRARYDAVRRQAREVDPAGPCGLIAIAMLTGRPMARIVEVLDELGYQRGAGIRQSVAWDALGLLGFSCSAAGGLFTPHVTRLDALVQNLATDVQYCGLGGRYLVSSAEPDGNGGHFSAVVDGVYCDTVAVGNRLVALVWEVHDA
ncbi:MAG: hypothetical protein RIB46_01265 [Pseudomonadales bacterium]